MLLRRALYIVQFGMAVALPLWVLVTRGIVADGVGWQLVVYLVLCPILFVALAALTGLTVARKSVRDARAVSWLDAAVQLVLYASILAYGLFAFSPLAVIIVLAVVGGFWVGVTQFVAETRQRVNALFDQGPRQIPDVIVVPRDPLSR